MKTEALIFIAQDPHALRMASAWPALPADARGDVEEWARLAGVPLPVARRAAPVLLAHGICLPDGTLAPLAAQYIAAAVAGTLPKRKTGK